MLNSNTTTSYGRLGGKKLFINSSLFLTCNSSTSTLRKVTEGSFLANSARNGAIIRHGPHQEAVKSTTICIERSENEKSFTTYFSLDNIYNNVHIYYNI